MKHLIYWICLLAVISGCSSESIYSEEKVEVSFLLTKNGGSMTGSTFRAQLFSMNSDRYLNYSGSYYYAPSGDSGISEDILMPWELDIEGNPVSQAKAPEMGLYAPENTYTMIVSSPGVAVSKVDDKYGFHYSRLPEENSEPLSISDGIPVKIKGRASAIGDNKLRDTLIWDNSYALLEWRAMMRVIVQCGNDVKQSEITKITLGNLISEAYVTPVSKELFYSAAQGRFSTADLILLNTGVTITNAGDPLKLPTTAEAVINGENYIYILPEDYSKGVDVNKPVYNIPELSIEFAEDSIDIPLGYEFKPLNYYTFIVTINSSEVTLSLSVVSGWSTAGDNGSVADPKESYLGTVVIDNWEKPSDDNADGSINGTIGGSN